MNNDQYIKTLLSICGDVIKEYHQHMSTLEVRSVSETIDRLRTWDNFVDYVDDVSYALKDETTQKKVNG